MCDFEPTADVLASRLVARLCHDISGPLSALQVGVDLILDPQVVDENAAALAVIADGLRRLKATLEFARVAFGASDCAIGSDLLKAIAQSLFVDARPTLEWKIQPVMLRAPVARIVLNLTQMAAEAASRGGIVSVTTPIEPAPLIVVEAADGRARIHEETQRGLTGMSSFGEPGGRWAQAVFVRSQAARDGGWLTAENTPRSVVFAAHLPRGV